MSRRRSNWARSMSRIPRRVNPSNDSELTYSRISSVIWWVFGFSRSLTRYFPSGGNSRIASSFWGFWACFIRFLSLRLLCGAPADPRLAAISRGLLDPLKNELRPFLGGHCDPLRADRVPEIEDLGGLDGDDRTFGAEPEIDGVVPCQDRREIREDIRARLVGSAVRSQ